MYKATDKTIWTGRKSDQQSYLHEKVECLDFENMSFDPIAEKRIILLGYACDEGVKRNLGRAGAVDGPQEIRKILAKLPNHLDKTIQLWDIGTLYCADENMEQTQEDLAQLITTVLNPQTFPIILGGGHDMAYGHYNGIRKYLDSHAAQKKIGILNFDAHFDLRSNENGNNSGTPFYQIAQNCNTSNTAFSYLCLGIRKDANIKTLFETAKQHGVQYIEQDHFNMFHVNSIIEVVKGFINEVDYIYTTIDLDGFSSAYAPGVSAPSPIGFAPDIVLVVMEQIISSKKLISLDIAELNPQFDIDHQTAKLAASLIHFIMHQKQLI